MAVAAFAARSRRWGRLVVAGALAAASLALPACGGGDSPAAPSTPSSPGGNVDPNASTGYGGVINKAKDTAGAQEQHDATLSTAATQP